MRAMIFAAGIGSRLKPFTLSHPKALAPVGGMPVLQRVIENVIHAGASEVVVNVHHFANQVVDFLNSHSFEATVNVSDESEVLLDTGGGILKARSFLDSDAPFVAHNADIVTNLDVRNMYNRHVDRGADVTLLCSERETSRYLYFDKQSGRLVGWCNEKTGQTKPEGFVPHNVTMHKLAFGGVHVINPNVFDVLEGYAPHNTPFSLTPFYLDNLNKLNIQFYTPEYNFMWCDIGTPQTLKRANELLESI